MTGTYSIIKKADGGAKFACYVKFNEAIDSGFYLLEKYPEGGEYWECELSDPIEIDAALQSTADADLAHWTEVDHQKATASSVKIMGGKIVL